MRKYAILLNGPPRVGKDHAANVLLREFKICRKLKFSNPLKLGVHASYGVDDDLNPDFFEDVKDEPNDIFFGMTPRQAYIYHSEEYMKPLHGKDVYGRILTNTVKHDRFQPSNALNKVYIIPDSGFVDETKPLIKEIGADNVLLVRLHSSLNGRELDFIGDSRSYLDLPNVEAMDLVNTRDSTFDRVVRAAVLTWFNRGQTDHGNEHLS